MIIYSIDSCLFKEILVEYNFFFKLFCEKLLIKKFFFVRWFVLILLCYKLKREIYYLIVVYKLEDGDVY